MTEKSDAEKAAEDKAAKEVAKLAKEAKDKANAFDPEEYKKDNIKPLDDLDVAFLKSYVRISIRTERDSANALSLVFGLTYTHTNTPANPQGLGPYADPIKNIEKDIENLTKTVDKLKGTLSMPSLVHFFTH